MRPKIPLLFEVPLFVETMKGVGELVGYIGPVFRRNVESIDISDSDYTTSNCPKGFNARQRIRRHAEGSGGAFNGGAYGPPPIDGKVK